MIAACTFLTGGSDYQDHAFVRQGQGAKLTGMLKLPNGTPSANTFEVVFKKLDIIAF